ncbi:MAG TPA: hypothetical protein VH575_36330 [Gemmataceae bacterium]|jgi:hypothetical protein
MMDDLSRREALRAIGTSLPAIGLTSGMGQQSAPSDEMRPESSSPDWRGKALVVYTRSSGLSMPMILTECRFESLGDRLFLAGIDQSCRRSLTEWTQGVRRCVAWEAVEGYLVFDSLDEYYSRLHDPSDEQEDAEHLYGLFCQQAHRDRGKNSPPSESLEPDCG